MDELSVADRWKLNLPVKLSELADLQAVSYSTARRWADDKKFPKVGNFIKREDFEDWWKKAAHRQTASRPQRSASDKSDARPRKSDSPGALPPRAARLLGEAV